MSKFNAVWNSLEQTVAAKWAPGIVAGIRHRGEKEFHAAGTKALGAPEAMEDSTRFRIASLSKPIAGALAATMIADGVFALDDSVEKWLPELAKAKVLLRPDAELDQTAPADKPITVRIGAFFNKTPLAVAMVVAGLAPNPIPPQMSPDQFMAGIANLPLAYQPGTHWMYHTSSDILSVFLSRAAGMPLHKLLKERITEPLGMNSTGFSADSATLATAYKPNRLGIEVFEDYNQAFLQAPQFESLGGGLISTVPDYLAFLCALADDTLLPPMLRLQMTTDQLSARERAGMTEMMGPTKSWGWQICVETAVSEPWTAVGRYGWTGGSGTSAFVDPSRDLIGVVFSQRLMSGPGESFSYFWQPLATAAESSV